MILRIFAENAWLEHLRRPSPSIFLLVASVIC